LYCYSYIVYNGYTEEDKTESLSSHIYPYNEDKNKNKNQIQISKLTTTKKKHLNS